MLLYHSNRDNRPEYLNSLFRMSVIQKGVIMWDMAHVSYYTSVAIQNNPVRLHYSHNYSPQFSEELTLHFAALYIKQAEYSAPGVPHMGWRLRLCHASWFLSFVALFFMGFFVWVFMYECHSSPSIHPSGKCVLLPIYYLSRLSMDRSVHLPEGQMKSKKSENCCIVFMIYCLYECSLVVATRTLT